jgi:hypothetical protein
VSFTIDVDSRDQPAIPQSFLGLSHEWPYVEEMSSQPKYMEFMNYLTSFGSGPMVVRIGGGSTDIQDFVPSDAVWDSLAKLHKGTGAKFIIGLNLEEGDPDLALRQMRKAQEKLPAGSIMTFEIGNEVGGGGQNAAGAAGAEPSEAGTGGLAAAGALWNRPGLDGKQADAHACP